MDTDNLKKRIMRRVYAIWVVRRVVPLGATTGFFAYLAFQQTATNFFVAKIVSNFFAVTTHNMWSAPGFIAVAMGHADPGVLFVISFSILASFVMAVKLLRSIRYIIRSKAYSMGLNYQSFD